MTSLVDRAIAAALASPDVTCRRVIAIWLFGSHASGTASAASDVDLAILCEPPLGPARANVMDHVALAIGRDADIIDLASTSATLAWEVVTTGVLALELDEPAVERYVLNARHAADDAEQRDRMVLLAQAGSLGTATR